MSEDLQRAPLDWIIDGIDLDGIDYRPKVKGWISVSCYWDDPHSMVLEYVRDPHVTSDLDDPDTLYQDTRYRLRAERWVTDEPTIDGTAVLDKDGIVCVRRNDLKSSCVWRYANGSCSRWSDVTGGSSVLVLHAPLDSSSVFV
jgi:hypothetical protein